MSDECKEGEGDDAFVTVRVSRELLAMLLNQWSAPALLMIIQPSPGNDHYEMVVANHECEKSE